MNDIYVFIAKLKPHCLHAEFLSPCALVRSGVLKFPCVKMLGHVNLQTSCQKFGTVAELLQGGLQGLRGLVWVMSVVMAGLAEAISANLAVIPNSLAGHGRANIEVKDCMLSLRNHRVRYTQNADYRGMLQSP